MSQDKATEKQGRQIPPNDDVSHKLLKESNDLFLSWSRLKSDDRSTSDKENSNNSNSDKNENDQQDVDQHGFTAANKLLEKFGKVVCERTSTGDDGEEIAPGSGGEQKIKQPKIEEQKNKTIEITPNDAKSDFRKIVLVPDGKGGRKIDPQSGSELKPEAEGKQSQIYANINNGTLPLLSYRDDNNNEIRLFINRVETTDSNGKKETVYSSPRGDGLTKETDDPKGKNGATRKLEYENEQSKLVVDTTVKEGQATTKLTLVAKGITTEQTRYPDGRVVTVSNNKDLPFTEAQFDPKTGETTYFNGKDKVQVERKQAVGLFETPDGNKISIFPDGRTETAFSASDPRSREIVFPPGHPQGETVRTEFKDPSKNNGIAAETKTRVSEKEFKATKEYAIPRADGVKRSTTTSSDLEGRNVLRVEAEGKDSAGNFKRIEWDNKATGKVAQTQYESGLVITNFEKGDVRKAIFEPGQQPKYLDQNGKEIAVKGEPVVSTEAVGDKIARTLADGRKVIDLGEGKTKTEFPSNDRSGRKHQISDARTTVTTFKDRVETEYTQGFDPAKDKLPDEVDKEVVKGLKKLTVFGDNAGENTNQIRLEYDKTALGEFEKDLLSRTLTSRELRKKTGIHEIREYDGSKGRTKERDVHGKDGKFEYTQGEGREKDSTYTYRRWTDEKGQELQQQFNRDGSVVTKFNNAVKGTLSEKYSQLVMTPGDKPGDPPKVTTTSRGEKAEPWKPQSIGTITLNGQQSEVKLDGTTVTTGDGIQTTEFAPNDLLRRTTETNYDNPAKNNGIKRETRFKGGNSEKGGGTRIEREFDPPKGDVKIETEYPGKNGQRTFERQNKEGVKVEKEVTDSAGKQLSVERQGEDSGGKYTELRSNGVAERRYDDGKFLLTNSEGEVIASGKSQPFENGGNKGLLDIDDRTGAVIGMRFTDGPRAGESYSARYGADGKVNQLTYTKGGVNGQPSQSVIMAKNDKGQWQAPDGAVPGFDVPTANNAEFKITKKGDIFLDHGNGITKIVRADGSIEKLDFNEYSKEIEGKKQYWDGYGWRTAKSVEKVDDKTLVTFDHMDMRPDRIERVAGADTLTVHFVDGSKYEADWKAQRQVYSDKQGNQKQLFNTGKVDAEKKPIWQEGKIVRQSKTAYQVQFDPLKTGDSSQTESVIVNTKTGSITALSKKGGSITTDRHGELETVAHENNRNLKVKEENGELVSVTTPEGVKYTRRANGVGDKQQWSVEKKGKSLGVFEGTITRDGAQIELKSKTGAQTIYDRTGRTILKQGDNVVQVTDNFGQQWLADGPTDKNGEGKWKIPGDEKSEVKGKLTLLPDGRVGFEQHDGSTIVRNFDKSTSKLNKNGVELEKTFDNGAHVLCNDDGTLKQTKDKKGLIRDFEYTQTEKGPVISKVSVKEGNNSRVSEKLVNGRLLELDPKADPSSVDPKSFKAEVHYQPGGSRVSVELGEGKEAVESDLHGSVFTYKGKDLQSATISNPVDNSILKVDNLGRLVDTTDSTNKLNRQFKYADKSNSPNPTEIIETRNGKTATYKQSAKNPNLYENGDTQATLDPRTGDLRFQVKEPPGYRIEKANGEVVNTDAFGKPQTLSSDGKLQKIFTENGDVLQFTYNKDQLARVERLRQGPPASSTLTDEAVKVNDKYELVPVLDPTTNDPAKRYKIDPTTKQPTDRTTYDPATGSRTVTSFDKNGKKTGSVECLPDGSKVLRDGDGKETRKEQPEQRTSRFQVTEEDKTADTAGVVSDTQSGKARSIALAIIKDGAISEDRQKEIDKLLNEADGQSNRATLSRLLRDQIATNSKFRLSLIESSTGNERKVIASLSTTSGNQEKPPEDIAPGDGTTITLMRDRSKEQAEHLKKVDLANESDKGTAQPESALTLAHQRKALELHLKDLPAHIKQQALQDMADFEARAKRDGLSDSEVAKTYFYANRMMESDKYLPPLDKSDGVRTALDLLYGAANCSQTDQGNKNTCGVTTTREQMLVSKPSLVGKIASDCLIDGKFNAPDGRQVKVDPKSMVAQLGAKCSVEDRNKSTDLAFQNQLGQVLDQALVNYAFQKNNQNSLYTTTTEPTSQTDTGERLEVDGKVQKFPNVTLSKLADINKTFLGRENVVTNKTADAISEGTVKISSQKELEEVLGSGLKDGGITLLVNANHPALRQGSGESDDTRWHAVTITDTKNDGNKTYYRVSDQRGTGSDKWLSGEDLFNATQKNFKGRVVDPIYADARDKEGKVKLNSDNRPYFEAKDRIKNEPKVVDKVDIPVAEADEKAVAKTKKLYLENAPKGVLNAKPDTPEHKARTLAEDYFKGKTDKERQTSLQELAREAVNGNDSALETARVLLAADATMQLQLASSGQGKQADLLTAQALSKLFELSANGVDLATTSLNQWVTGEGEELSASTLESREGLFGSLRDREKTFGSYKQKQRGREAERDFLRLLDAPESEQKSRLLTHRMAEVMSTGKATLPSFTAMKDNLDAITRANGDLVFRRNPEEAARLRKVIEKESPHLVAKFDKQVDMAKLEQQSEEQKRIELGAKLLDRNIDPKQRNKALQSFESLIESQAGSARKSYEEQLSQLTALNTGLNLTSKDSSEAAKALDSLASLAKGPPPNATAARLLTAIGDEGERNRIKAKLSSPNSLNRKSAQEDLAERLKPAIDAQFNSLGLDRIMKTVADKPTAADFGKLQELLKKEIKSGNQQAGEWLRWVSVAKPLQELQEIENGDPKATEKARKAFSALAQQARNQNPYAHKALNCLLAGDQVRAKLDHLQNTKETTRKINAPTLDSLAPELQRELKLSAALLLLDESKHNNGTMNKADALVLESTMKASKSSGDKGLEGLCQTIINQALIGDGREQALSVIKATGDDSKRRATSDDGTQLTYDRKGRLAAARHPGGATRSFDYDADGQLIQINDSSGNKLTRQQNGNWKHTSKNGVETTIKKDDFKGLDNNGGYQYYSTDKNRNGLPINGRALTTEKVDGSSVEKLNGKVSRVTNATGQVREFGYDEKTGKLNSCKSPSGTLWKATNPDATEWTTTVHDKATTWKGTSDVDADGNLRDTYLDGVEKGLTRIYDTAGGFTTIDSEKTAIALNTARGERYEVERDKNKEIISVKKPDGTVMKRQGKDEATGLPIWKTIKEGKETGSSIGTFELQEGQFREVTASGTTIAFKNGKTVRMDSKDRVLAESRPDNSTSNYLYESGILKGRIDHNADKSVTTYDQMGAITNVKLANGQQRNFEYKIGVDGSRYVSRISESNGTEWLSQDGKSYSQVGSGNTIQGQLSIFANGKYTIDTARGTTFVRDSDNATLVLDTTNPDPAKREAVRINEDGSRIHRDNNGQLESTMDTTGKVTKYKTDDKGKILEITEPGGDKWTSTDGKNFTKDKSPKEKREIHVDRQNGTKTLVERNKDGSIKQETSFNLDGSIVTKDSQGRAVSVKDKNGNKSDLKYIDNSTQPTDIQRTVNGDTTTYRTDDAGKTWRVDGEKAPSMSISVDGNGNITIKTDERETSVQTNSWLKVNENGKTHYETTLGDGTGISKNDQGLISEVRLKNGDPRKFEYDKEGKLIAQVDPEGMRWTRANTASDKWINSKGEERRFKALVMESGVYHEIYSDKSSKIFKLDGSEISLCPKGKIASVLEPENVQLQTVNHKTADLKTALEKKDGAAVQKLLEGTSKLERKAIVAAFKNLTHKDLESEIKTKLSGPDQTKALEALSKDKTGDRFKRSFKYSDKNEIIEFSEGFSGSEKTYKLLGSPSAPSGMGKWEGPDGRDIQMRVQLLPDGTVLTEELNGSKKAGKLRTTDGVEKHFSDGKLLNTTKGNGVTYEQTKLAFRNAEGKIETKECMSIRQPDGQTEFVDTTASQPHVIGVRNSDGTTFILDKDKVTQVQDRDGKILAEYDYKDKKLSGYTISGKKLELEPGTKEAYVNLTKDDRGNARVEVVMKSEPLYKTLTTVSLEGTKVIADALGGRRTYNNSGQLIETFNEKQNLGYRLEWNADNTIKSTQHFDASGNSPKWTRQEGNRWTNEKGETWNKETNIDPETGSVEELSTDINDFHRRFWIHRDEQTVTGSSLHGAADVIEHAFNGGSGWTGDKEKATVEQELTDRNLLERQILNKVWTARHGHKYGHSLFGEFRDEFSEGEELSKFMHLLYRDNKGPDYAGKLLNDIKEAGQWTSLFRSSGRSIEQVEKSIRDTLRERDFKEIEELNRDVLERQRLNNPKKQARSLKEMTVDNDDLTQKTRSANEIYLKGKDFRTDDDILKLADLALEAKDLDMFHEVWAGATDSSRERFKQNGGEDRIKKSFSGFNWSGLLSPVNLAFSRSTDSVEANRAMDFYKYGERSLATKVDENSSIFGDNESEIEKAARELPPKQRELYLRGRLLELGLEQDKAPLDLTKLSDSDRKLYDRGKALVEGSEKISNRPHPSEIAEQERKAYIRGHEISRVRPPVNRDNLKPADRKALEVYEKHTNAALQDTKAIEFYVSQKRSDEFDKEARGYYKNAKEKFAVAGNEAEQLSWDALAAYRGDNLLSSLHKHKGFWYDSSTHEVMKTIEDMNSTDWERLKIGRAQFHSSGKSLDEVLKNSDVSGNYYIDTLKLLKTFADGKIGGQENLQPHERDELRRAVDLIDKKMDAEAFASPAERKAIEQGKALAEKKFDPEKLTDEQKTALKEFAKRGHPPDSSKMGAKEKQLYEQGKELSEQISNFKMFKDSQKYEFGKSIFKEGKVAPDKLDQPAIAALGVYRQVSAAKLSLKNLPEDQLALYDTGKLLSDKLAALESYKQKSFDASKSSGNRDLRSAIEDNFHWYNDAEDKIYDSIQRMSPEEVAKWKAIGDKHGLDIIGKERHWSQLPADERQILTRLKDKLSDSEFAVARGLLEQALVGKKPTMEIMDKLRLQASYWNGDEAQAVRDISQAFKEDPGLRARINNPRSANEIKRAFEISNNLREDQRFALDQAKSQGRFDEELANQVEKMNKEDSTLKVSSDELRQAYQIPPNYRKELMVARNEGESKFREKLSELSKKETSFAVDFKTTAGKAVGSGDYAEYIEPLLRDGKLDFEKIQNLNSGFFNDDEQGSYNDATALGSQLSMKERENYRDSGKLKRAFSHLSDDEKAIATNAFMQGEFRPEDKLRSYIVGFGTSEDEIKQVLSQVRNRDAAKAELEKKHPGLSVTDEMITDEVNKRLDHLKAEYEKKYDSLEGDLKGDLSGQDLREAMRGIRREAANPLEASLYARQILYDTYGLGTWLAENSFLGDGTTAELGDTYERLMGRIDQEGFDPEKLYSAEEARQDLIRVGLAQDASQETQNFIADTTIDAILTAAAIAASIPSVGGSMAALSAHFLSKIPAGARVVAAISRGAALVNRTRFGANMAWAVAGGTFKVGAKHAMVAGHDLVDDGFRDFMDGAVNAFFNADVGLFAKKASLEVTETVGKAIGKVAGKEFSEDVLKQTLKETLKEGEKELLEKFGGKLLNENANQTFKGLNKLADDAIKGLDPKRGLKGMADDMVSKSLPKELRESVVAQLQNTIEKSFYTAVKSQTDNLTNLFVKELTWNMRQGLYGGTGGNLARLDFDHGLEANAQQLALGGLMGIGMGGSFTLGFKAIGAGLHFANHTRTWASEKFGFAKPHENSLQPRLNGVGDVPSDGAYHPNLTPDKATVDAISHENPSLSKPVADEFSETLTKVRQGWTDDLTNEAKLVRDSQPKVEEARRLLDEEIGRLKAAGVSEEEIKLASKNGSHELNKNNRSSLFELDKKWTKLSEDYSKRTKLINEVTQARRDELQKEINVFIQKHNANNPENPLAPVKVQIAEHMHAAGGYAFGEGVVVLSKYDLVGAHGGQGLSKIAFHELVHAQQDMAIVRRSIHETTNGGSQPIDFKLVSDNYKAATGRDLDKKWFQNIAQQTQNASPMTPAQLLRAKALADELSVSQPIAEESTKLGNTARILHLKAEALKNAGDPQALNRLMKELNDPQNGESLARHLFGDSIPEDVQKMMKDWKTREKDASTGLAKGFVSRAEIRSKLARELDARRDFINTKHKTLIDTYASSRLEQEAYGLDSNVREPHEVIEQALSPARVTNDGLSDLTPQDRLDKTIARMEQEGSFSYIEDLKRLPGGVVQDADKAQDVIFKEIVSYLHQNNPQHGSKSLHDQGWRVYQTQKYSPADQAKADYILVNSKTGQYHLVDATAQVGKSDNIVKRINWDRSHLDSKTMTLSEAGVAQVNRAIDDAVNGKSSLNVIDHPPPSLRRKPHEQALAEVKDFRRALSQSDDPKARSFAKNDLQGVENYFVRELRQLLDEDFQLRQTSLDEQTDKQLHDAITEYLQGESKFADTTIKNKLDIKQDRDDFLVREGSNRHKTSLGATRIQNAFDQEFAIALKAASGDPKRTGELVKLKQQFEIHAARQRTMAKLSQKEPEVVLGRRPPTSDQPPRPLRYSPEQVNALDAASRTLDEIADGFDRSKLGDKCDEDIKLVLDLVAADSNLSLHDRAALEKLIEQYRPENPNVIKQVHDYLKGEHDAAFRPRSQEDVVKESLSTKWKQFEQVERTDGNSATVIDGDGVHYLLFQPSAVQDATPSGHQVPKDLHKTDKYRRLPVADLEGNPTKAEYYQVVGTNHYFKVEDTAFGKMQFPADEIVRADARTIRGRLGPTWEAEQLRLRQEAEEMRRRATDLPLTPAEKLETINKRLVDCGTEDMTVYKMKEEYRSLLNSPDTDELIATFERLGITDHDKYKSLVLESDTKKMMVYKVDGRDDLKIYLPEEGKEIRERVRQLRVQSESSDPAVRANALKELQSHECANILLPEDIVRHLDKLPDGGLAVKKIVIHDGRNPSDSWSSYQYRDKTNYHFTSAATAKDSTINFYGSTSRGSSDVESTLKHEWAHLLEEQNSFLRQSYEQALEIEKLSGQTYNHSNYSTYNSSEDWAVHAGEVVIAQDVTAFHNMVNGVKGTDASLKLLLIVKALEESMEKASKEGFHVHGASELKSRLDYAKEKLQPWAHQRTLQVMNDPVSGKSIWTQQLLSDLTDKHSSKALLKSISEQSTTKQQMSSILLAASRHMDQSEFEETLVKLMKSDGHLRDAAMAHAIRHDIDGPARKLIHEHIHDGSIPARTKAGSSDLGAEALYTAVMRANPSDQVDLLESLAKHLADTPLKRDELFGIIAFEADQPLSGQALSVLSRFQDLSSEAKKALDRIANDAHHPINRSSADLELLKSMLQRCDH